LSASKTRERRRRIDSPILDFAALNPGCSPIDQNL
jgi:hypothetical protein